MIFVARLVNHERLKISLKVIIFVIFLTVVCAKEKCRLSSDKFNDSHKVLKEIECDLALKVTLEYRNISDDQP